mmetsp:Transcript_12662/g.18605  ORF Transcript_12662/g.18605 Transcript_12662/m.18605 type:complete len:361 (-) Transcript_12662:67-1149(-)
MMDDGMPSLSLRAKPLEDALLIPQMDESEVADRLKALLRQEDTTYCRKDFVGKNRIHSESKLGKKRADELCRAKICTWCYQVADLYKFQREIVAVSMSYLDRFLCTKKDRGVLDNLKDYQLVAMASLFMAIKLHEPLKMNLAQFVALGRGCYDEKEIIATEKRLLTVLDWQIQDPTALAFCVHLLAFLPDSVHPAAAEATLDYARYQTELAIFNHRLLSHKLSHVAFAAILNAVKGMSSAMLNDDQKEMFLRTVEKHSGILIHDVEKTQEVLDDIMLEVYANEIPEVDEQVSFAPCGRSIHESDIEVEEASHQLLSVKLRNSRSWESPDCAANLSEYLESCQKKQKKKEKKKKKKSRESK